MSVAEVLTCLAFMVAAVRIREPLGTVVDMSVMCLMKARLINGLRHAFDTYKEHCGNQELEDSVTHINRLHKYRLQIQSQFTDFGVYGRLPTGLWDAEGQRGSSVPLSASR